jgi:outer membrane protein OmpA-like peptidoglycan-associated protein
MKNPIIHLPGAVIAALGVIVAVAVGCATAPPVELISARTAYARASAGPAAQLAPADLRKARLALDQAERAISDEKNLEKGVDFAYIAERNAQIAEAHAGTALAEKETSKATRDLGDKQGNMAKQSAGTLSAARAQLAEAQRGEAAQAQEIGVERAARQAAEQQADVSEQKADASDEKAAASEQRAQQANDALNRSPARPDGRGTVIVLPGSVLFRSNRADLLPSAMKRLDEVASVVLVAQEQDVVVEGYTDSKGSPWKNVDLSRRRAEAVRRYLVSRGCPADRIVARGLGPDRPVADNASGEGRANNRPIEIVINRP